MEMNLSATAFILPDNADFQIRYFTPIPNRCNFTPFSLPVAQKIVPLPQSLNKK